MTWPTQIIIDCVFIPLYATLLLLNLPSVVKHAHDRSGGLISLLLVTVLHLVGNVMLVVACTKHNASATVVIWGSILQSVGLSPLISSVLAIWSHARSTLHPRDKWSTRVVRMMNLVNMVALVCLITGYTGTDFTDDHGVPLKKPHLAVQTKVGAVLYILLSFVLVLLVVLGLRHIRRGQQNAAIRPILLVASTLMLIRSAYAAYTTFSASLLVPRSIWTKLVLQYITELAALTALTCLPFLIKKTTPNAIQVSSFDVERDGTQLPAKPLQAWSPAQVEFQQYQPSQMPSSPPPPPPPH